MPSQKEGEPLSGANGQKGKGDTTSLDPKLQVNEAFGTSLNGWILKPGVQVSVDEIAWDIDCEHGQGGSLDNGLVDEYVDSLAHGDPIQRIQVILEDMAGITCS